jgi:SNF2 family DNA or RNA helicase
MMNNTVLPTAIIDLSDEEEENNIILSDTEDDDVIPLPSLDSSFQIKEDTQTNVPSATVTSPPKKRPSSSLDAFDSTPPAKRIRVEEVLPSSQQQEQQQQQLSTVGAKFLITPEILLDKKLRDLYDHQYEGIKFLWKYIAENEEGCVLAHEQGLGKTRQVAYFIYNLKLHRQIKRFVILCTKTIMQVWEDEFKSLNQKVEAPVNVYSIRSTVKDDKRIDVLKQWHDNGDVLLCTYSLFTKMSKENKPKIEFGHYSTSTAKNVFAESTYNFTPSHKDISQEHLGSIDHEDNEEEEEIEEGSVRSFLYVSPEVFILDEAQIVKNSKTIINLAVSRVQTTRKIMLTGTPFQNNLREFYTLCKWARSGNLWDYESFKTNISAAIENGVFADSTAEERQLCNTRMITLHRELQFIHRRTVQVIAEHLPVKRQYVIMVKLGDLAKRMYMDFIMQVRPSDDRNKVIFIFHMLTKLVNHVDMVAAYMKRKGKLFQELLKATEVTEKEIAESVYVDKDDNAQASTDHESQEYEDYSEEDPYLQDEIDFYTWTSDYLEDRYREQQQASEEKAIETLKDEWSLPLLESDFPSNNIHGSSKMAILIRMVQQLLLTDEKMLIFSQSREMMDIMEKIFTTKKITPDGTPLAKGLDFYRMDGLIVNPEHRARLIEQFNTIERVKIFLLNTRVGGVGITLTRANKVVLYDVPWDPTISDQALSRVYRIGQQRPVSVYHFVTAGTFENHMFNRGIVKQLVARELIDRKASKIKISRSDVDLFDDTKIYEACKNKMINCEDYNDDSLLAKILGKQKQYTTHFRPDIIPTTQVSDMEQVEDQDSMVSVDTLVSAVFRYEKQFQEEYRHVLDATNSLPPEPSTPAPSRQRSFNSTSAAKQRAIEKETAERTKHLPCIFDAADEPDATAPRPKKKVVKKSNAKMGRVLSLDTPSKGDGS